MTGYYIQNLKKTKSMKKNNIIQKQEKAQASIVRNENKQQKK